MLCDPDVATIVIAIASQDHKLGGYILIGLILTFILAFARSPEHMLIGLVP